MRWIVSARKEIYVDEGQMEARHNYIEQVTNAEVTKWRLFEHQFFWCISDDGLNGTCITAHVGEAKLLCTLPDICCNDFVIVNSCVWKQSTDKEVLKQMIKYNPNVKLFYAKQKLSKDSQGVLRQCAILDDMGRFGFHTSLSERQLFRKREYGFMAAVKESYNEVSLLDLR